MGQRMVWILVLADILEVINLPLLRYMMHTMSSSELMQKAIHLARVDSLLSQDTIAPANIRSYRVDADMVEATIAPGGDGIMLLSQRGHLHVYQTGKLAQLEPLVLLRHDDMGGSRLHEPFPSLILSSSGKHQVAVACDFYSGLLGYVFSPTIYNYS